MDRSAVRLSVSDFIALTNQTLEYAYTGIEIEGEVASFKVNQGKYVFFDVKDSESSIGCFMMVFALRIPIEDGMKVIIRGTPKLTKWGKFSVTVQSIRPSGEGSLKKSFELLKLKLEQEGLFGEDRKRALPYMPSSIGVISSTSAAGYADFIKILDERWGNMQVDVAHVQVQGEAAPDQMIRALQHFNQMESLPDVIVIVRGGGSADDLSCFNDELLVRAVSASRVPVLTGIGHEIDMSLTDMAADLSASTPSNAAQLLAPDKKDTMRHIRRSLNLSLDQVSQRASTLSERNRDLLKTRREIVLRSLDQLEQKYSYLTNLMSAYDPKKALERGYAIVRGDIGVGNTLLIETAKKMIETEVRNVETK